MTGYIHAINKYMMGLVIVFFAIGSASGQDIADLEALTEQLSHDVHNTKMVPLAKVLNKLEADRHISFVYESGLMEGKQVPQKALNAPDLAGNLSGLLKEQGLAYHQQAQGTYVIRRLDKKAKKLGAATQITGTVTDGQSGETLPGVNILVKGTSTGASTDADGQFELEVESLQDTLVVSFVGYLTKEVPIDGRTTIDVSLQTQAVQGEEMVVIGYGEQKKENLTGSVESIEGADLAEQPAVQTSSALQGMAPGVTVTQASGQPGEDGGSIRIRGIGTLGGGSKNEPLVLIDGIQGNIDEIPSSDIENISILKDASAAAIYGSRAANGVILIKTKRGKEGNFQVSYNGSFGLQQATSQPEYVNGGTFMRLENMGSINLGKEPVWSQEDIDGWEANHISDPDKYPNTDWVDAIFTDPAYQTQHQLGVSGGSEKVQYYTSLQYDNQTAEIPNFQFRRYSIRLNTDIKASDKIKFKFDAYALRNDKKQPSQSLVQIIQQAYRLSPLYIARYSNGEFGPGRNGKNPLAFAEVGGLNQRETSVYRGRLQGEYNPIPALTLRLMYAPDYRSIFQKDMTKKYQVSDPETGEDINTQPAKNSLSENFTRSFTNNINLTAHYDQDLNEHSFELLGGYELIDYRTDNFNAFRDNFALQDFEQLDAGSKANQQNGGSAAEYSLESFFGRANYAYKDKYLFEANIRYDGSSRFVDEERWGIFPSFSAGWRISEESFMDPFDFISELKIKGSWGKLGNQEIGNYPFLANVNLGQNFIFGSSVVSGAAQLDLANSGISWEDTETTDVGIDLSLYENRFDLTFDLFKRKTNNILLQLPVPLIIGLNAPFQNAGSVENTGWELQFGYNNSIGTNFTYSTSFNISGITNKVTDLKGAGPIISDNSITKEGSPINSIYGYESDGLFDSQEEIDNHATQEGQIAPGDIKYVDQNEDGEINADDRVVIGNPFPDLNYGINLSARYKTVDVSALFQGVGSRDVLLQGDAAWAFYNAGKITQWEADHYWRPEQPNNDYPRLTATTNHNNFKSSSYWAKDASYLRLRNLQVGYTIPTEWADKISVNKLRIYFVGQNLFTWFDNLPDGIDPNVPNNTIGAFFPVQKLYSFGINIKF